VNPLQVVKLSGINHNSLNTDQASLSADRPINRQANQKVLYLLIR